MYLETISAYIASVAQGTAQNRLRQAKTYLTFAIYYDVNYLQPTILDASMYTKYLANSFISAASVSNYISGARHWILHHKGDPSSFNSAESSSVGKFCQKSSRHVPNQAPPLTPDHIRTVTSWIDIHRFHLVSNLLSS